MWAKFPSLIQNNGSKRVRHDTKHVIELSKDARPVKCRPRRLLGPKLEAAKRAFAKLEKAGFIRRSKSRFASPLHLVPKGQDYRTCGDYVAINAMTEPDNYPLPHIQDFVADLEGKTIFSKIDMVKAYHQIPMAEDSIPFTAVMTPFGLWEWLVMPFGLCNAAQTFQRFIDEVTQGLPNKFVYLDDILVASSTKEEHEKDLRLLFKRLQDYGLTVNPAKCELGESELMYCIYMYCNVL